MIRLNKSLEIEYELNEKLKEQCEALKNTTSNNEELLIMANRVEPLTIENENLKQQVTDLSRKSKDMASKNTILKTENSQLRKEEIKRNKEELVKNSHLKVSENITELHKILCEKIHDLEFTEQEQNALFSKKKMKFDEFNKQVCSPSQPYKPDYKKFYDGYKTTLLNVKDMINSVIERNSLDLETTYDYKDLYIKISSIKSNLSFLSL